MDALTLIPHAKPGTTFGPLDVAELARLNGEAKLSFAKTLLKRDLPSAVRESLEAYTGEASTYTAEDRQRAFIRNRLGTEGMEYPVEEPAAEDNEDEDGMMLDFGDEEDPEEETPSPMAPLATAFFEALGRAAQNSGQISVMPEIVKAAQACNDTKSITPLYPIFSKKDRELAMMAPHMAQDAKLEETLLELAQTIPFAQVCMETLAQARQGIADGFKPSAVLASAFFYLMAEKG